MSEFNVHTMDFTGSYYFTNKIGNSNKWWKVEFPGGNQVRYTFARIGLTCSRPAEKTFSSHSQLQREVTKKIMEKLAEGYEYTQEEALQRETQVAQQLGTQYKIMAVYYVTDIKSNRMEFGEASFYQPEKGVVAHVLQSWTQQDTWLWLSKSDSKELVVPSLAADGKSITFSRQSVPQGNFVRGVREFLKSASQKVKQFICTFAQMGRTLFGESEEEDDLVVAQLNKESPGMSKSLISSFASLGDRVLEL